MLAGGLFKGVPTGMSQRWPGSPCLGLSAAVDTLLFAPGSIGCTGWLVMTGCDESVVTVGVLVYVVIGAGGGVVSTDLTPPD